MNDFAELENELRKLRPALPFPILFERVEQALGDCRAGASPAEERRSLVRRWGGLEATPPWSLFGLGLAAAAVLVLFAVARIDWQHERRETIAKTSPAYETTPVLGGSENSIVSGKFIPAGATHVVYHARDEGLYFADGSERPVRRVRYQTQQTWQWRNPTTGASLRVSYPTEDVVLIPVSGQ